MNTNDRTWLVQQQVVQQVCREAWSIKGKITRPAHDQVPWPVRDQINEQVDQIHEQVREQVQRQVRGLLEQGTRNT